MEIRKFEKSDLEQFLAFAGQFYASDSVDHPIPQKNMVDAFGKIIADSPYIDGFMILSEGQPAGYALLDYTYSMEFGGMLAILDELFISPACQGKGLGSQFLHHMKDHLSEGIKAFRLEFVTEKSQLQKLYEKQGFKMMGYSSMIHSID